MPYWADLFSSWVNFLKISNLGCLRKELVDATAMQVEKQRGLAWRMKRWAGSLCWKVVG